MVTYNNRVSTNSICICIVGLCLLWNGEQMSGCVYVQFHIAVLQLHEAASDLHLLPEGRQELLLQ